jgi:flagellar biosynthesis GTPase FlhF
MELKRILANDAKTANDRAMSLYGRDVLIISSHSVGGQTELIVALDIDEQAPESVVTVARSDFPLAGPSVSFSSQMARVSAETKAGPTAAGATAAPVPAKTADTPLAKPEPVNIQPGAQFDREVMDQILDELKSLRREVSLNQKISGWHSNLDLAPEVENLLMSFTHAGMPTGLRTLLVDTVKDMRSEKEALEAVRHQLEQVVHRPSLALPKSGIHLVAGPSGTGKTLMVVRLASHAAAQVDAGRVAMVSYRDLRLGAWPQTLSMAREAGVECFRADTPEALSTVLAALSGYSLILIDTSGNQLSQRVTEIQSVCPSCLAHAMVAADSSTATLRRTLRLSGIRWNSLMISKLDESVQPWPLVEFLCDNFISLSAASEGVDPGGLKCDLTTGALVEMALAHLSRVPDSNFQIPAIKLTKPSPVKLPAPSPRMFMSASPKGLRGPFA